MNDPVMESFGRLMLATELRAVRYYWTVRENNRHIFPEPIKKYGVLGQLQEDGIFYYMINWECDPDQFPQRHACLVGIQLIPIMSISHWYVDQVRPQLYQKSLGIWIFGPRHAGKYMFKYK